MFEDVPPPHPFYFYVECLGGRGIMTGYNCGGPGEPCGAGNKPYFRPANNLTRGQAAKLVASAVGYQDPIPTTQQTFEDVPITNAFWLSIEQMVGHGVISGYQCGGPGEPCGPQLRPYFRPFNTITRGQFAKVDANTAGYQDPIPTTQQTFADLPFTNPFWVFVERIAGRGIIAGYTCGAPGEPCDPQQRPYFRWAGNITRGQTTKVLTNTFFPGCQPLPTPTPARRP